MAQREEDYLAISLEPETTTDEKKGLPKILKTFIRHISRPEKILIAVIAVIAFLVIAPIIVIPVLPPMLALYYIALIVQVFRSDVDNQVAWFLGSVAKWLWIFFAVISVELLLCMLIFEVTPSLKHRTFHGLSIARWTGVLAIICVLLTYSMLVRYLLGYRRLQRLEHNEETVHLYEGIIGAINSLFYLLALFSIIRVAPLLKENTILGHPTQKWVRMIILLVLGHFAVRIFTSSIVVLFRIEAVKDGVRKSKRLLSEVNGNGMTWLLNSIEAFTGISPSPGWTRYIVYYAEGLRTSFNFVLTLLLVLLTWILYLGSRLDRSSSRVIGVVYDRGWRTLACVLAGGVLWLVKSGIILTWRARVVYDRFDKKILGAAKQLYLLGFIAGPYFDILGVWKMQRDRDRLRINEVRVTDENEGKEGATNREREDTSEGATKSNGDAKGIAHSRAEILLRDKFNGLQYISDIGRMARYFIAAEEPLSKESYCSDFVAEWSKANHRLINHRKFEEGPIRTLHGHQLKQDHFGLLKAQLEKENYKLKRPEQWITEYHKVCLELGKTIAGAMEGVDCLDNIMIVVIVAAMIIAWLFLTETATTKVLILVVSPIAGASFIFGESCATLFKGIMFAYVMHPFDVGDLCTIDKIQLEVKRIGLWKTIFSKVGFTDEVVYPNTALANLSIINHKGELDPNDCVEMKLDSTTRSEQITQLKLKIERYLNKKSKNKRFEKHPYGVLLKEVGVDLTMVVHFKHSKTTIEAMTSIDGLHKKSKMRHKFLVKMKRFLEELHTKEDTNVPSSG